MTKENKNRVGENMLEKLIRLMSRYENQLRVEETEREIKINISLFTDGSGTVFANFVEVYTFIDLNGLLSFLEAGQLKRTLMARG